MFSLKGQCQAETSIRLLVATQYHRSIDFNLSGEMPKLLRSPPTDGNDFIMSEEDAVPELQAAQSVLRFHHGPVLHVPEGQPRMHSGH